MKNNNLFISVFFVCSFITSAFSQQLGGSLEENFKNPPERAKPRTWMHAMSGNMSSKGMTKDLEAIQKAGIGGILLFNVSHTIPEGNIIFNSEKHQELIKHTAQECERLGLSFGVHNCDGWTSSGGPWNTPENSMKMVVWSETIVKGGTINLHLEKPTARKGFYKDIAVVAYPSLSSELSDASVHPVISSSDDLFDTSIVSDGKWDASSVLHASDTAKNWVQFDFKKPYGVRSVHMALNKTISGSRKSTLSISNDGEQFIEVKTFNLKRLAKREFAIDESFPEIRARYFRITIEDNYDVMEVALTKRQNYPNFLAKTSLFKVENHRLKPIPAEGTGAAIDKKTILKLTDKMDEHGELNAILPKGNWTVMRFGFTTTGAVNSPASDAGRGLEVDKMRKEALKIHYDAYVGKVVQNTKDVAPNALQYLEIDSFEVGGQNWTDEYESLFSEKYGHTLIPFLPLYAGRVVESAEASDAVLWEIRQLNSDLITENYFGHFTELTHRDGLISYIEPYSFNAPFNELDAAKQTDIPMGEFWMHQRYQTQTAVSGARIYGKKIISAESFSARPEINWQGHPGMSKTTGDMAWILGINEFMFHRYAHQANTHVVPGMTMSQWGSHIDRTQTWWEHAGSAWFKYIARGSYLLRQGNPVSDVLVYVGEGSPSSNTRRTSFSTPIPNTLNYDNINTDALLHRIEGKDGRLVLPEGTSYRMLALHNTDIISLQALEKIHTLSQQGILIVGKKPTKLAGYVKSSDDLKRFENRIEAIWSKDKTITQFDWNAIFKSKDIPYDLIASAGDTYLPYIHRKEGTTDIYFISNQEDQAQNVTLQFSLTGKIPELWDPMTGTVTKVAWYHDSDEGTEMKIQLKKRASTFIIFREDSSNLNQVIACASPQGAQPTFTFDSNKNIKLHTDRIGIYHLTFKNGQKKSVNVTNIGPSKNIDNSWYLRFKAPYKYKHELMSDTLFDWSKSAFEEIKHFSGTVAYRTKLKLKKRFFHPEQKYTLDLGNVQVVAKVSVNKKDVATLWCPPYAVDITEYLKSGENELEIAITNTWTNRLIGDEHYERTDSYTTKRQGAPLKMPGWYTENKPLPTGKRVTFSAFPFYKKTDPLLASGLLGPVTINVSKTVTVE